MKLYNATVSFEMSIVVLADNEEHANKVAYFDSYAAYNDQRPDPLVTVVGEVSNEKDLPDGWDRWCIPYGAEENRKIAYLLSAEGKDKP